MRDVCNVQCQACKKIFNEYQYKFCPHCGTCPKCDFKHPVSQRIEK